MGNRTRHVTDNTRSATRRGFPLLPHHAPAHIPPTSAMTTSPPASITPPPAITPRALVFTQHACLKHKDPDNDDVEHPDRMHAFQYGVSNSSRRRTSVRFRDS